MITAGVAFLLALAVALALTPVVRSLARRLGALDDPTRTERKIHGKAIPRLGGLAIAAAFYAPLVGLLLVDSEVGRRFSADSDKVLGLFVGGLAIVGLGVYDDIKGANAPKKLAVQFGVAALLYLLGFRISQISIPLGFTLDLGYLDLPVTLLWIAGVINAFNLIDGLDGLASGIAFFAAATTLVVAALNDNVVMTLFMATTAGAVLGFLFYNFNPASIFMGDTGSMFLGFVMAVTSVQTSTKSGATVAMLAPVLALGIPIMDTLLAMARRFLRGRPMFQADRGHIHHRLLMAGLSHRNAVLTLYVMSLLLGLAAIAVTVSRGPEVALVLVATVVAVAIFMRALGYLKLRSFGQQAGEARAERLRNHESRRIMEQVVAELKAANSLDDVWAALTPLGPCLHAAVLKLELTELQLGTGPEERSYGWRAEAPQNEPLYAARWQLSPGTERGQGFLEVAWSDGRTALGPNDETLIGTTADALARALVRLVARAALGRATPLYARRVQ